MTFDDYKECIKSDIRDYIENEGLKDELDYDSLYNKMYMSDSVTGYPSGSYYCSSYKARQAIIDVLFTDELSDMFKSMGYDRVPIEKGEEYIDCSIRCFLLSECLSEVLDELEAEEEKEADNASDD